MKRYNPNEITALVSRAAGVPVEAAAAVESELRRVYGGSRLTIPAQAPVSVSASRIDELLRQRLTVTEIAPKLGVSRSTIYRHLRAGLEAKRAKKSA